MMDVLPFLPNFGRINEFRLDMMSGLKRRLFFLMWGWMGCLLPLCAQYTVTGGAEGSPMMAVENTSEKLQVYVVYGTAGVRLSYTSSSTSHQWYRYKTRQLEAEKISSVQNGTTSTVDQVEDGYGYFVLEDGQLPHFVWIIDYSRYQFSLPDIRVSDNSDPCASLLLTSSLTEIPKMSYNLPSSGIPVELKRSYEITYNTMEYSEEEGRFDPKEATVTLTGNLFQESFEAPMCDTDICLSGDQFASHFGKEVSLCTDYFEASRVEAHIDTLLVEQTGLNVNTTNEGLCAPVEAQFMAVANTPVAAIFNWKIYRKDDAEQTAVAQFSGEELAYTFNEAGEFVVSLEVSDRTATCSWAEELELKIAESYLMVPNAFSPGTSPGVNDEFRVAYKSLTRFKGWIFNRWGVEMFRWTDPSQGWDGKKGGKYVAPGVYFYVIEAEGSDGIKYKKKGAVNILRPKSVSEQVEGEENVVE